MPLFVHAHLSTCLVQSDRYRVAQIQAAHILCHDRYAKDLIGWIVREEFLTEPFGFASKDQRIIGGEVCRMIDPGSKLREEPHLPGLSCFEVAFPCAVPSELYMRPIIESGASYRFLGEVKSEGPNQVEWGVGRRAGTGD